MRSTRLTFALDTGALTLPSSGQIAVYGPRIGDDLSLLPDGRVTVVTGFRPAHDHFAARGFAVTKGAGGPYAAAVVCLPRAKAEARALIAQAMTEVVPGGPIAVDGQKTDGADAILRDCRDLGLVTGEVLSKAHGKLAVLSAGTPPQGWNAVPQIIEGGFQTLPGVFSAGAADRGSALLAQALPATMPARVVDLGAGWGYLARAILSRPGVQILDLVEAEAQALACARHNIPDLRARFHWADATTFKPDRPAQAVVMNPPFHTGREADPDLGAAFLNAAARMLTPDGSLWFVANRHLPYAAVLTTLFRTATEIGGDSAFRLTHASHPHRLR